MHAVRHADLAPLVFAAAFCAVFGGLFAWVLSIPFWLGFAMVGAALFTLALSGEEGQRVVRRRRWAARASRLH
jgi:hypothetical protein